MSILISLTPAESKRLIGKGMTKHPLVQEALKTRKILVSSGSTTGYFIDELMEETFPIERFPCGVVTSGVLCTTPDDRIRSMLIDKGQIRSSDENISDYNELDLWNKEMTKEDVYIKGANAVDVSGRVGFLLAHPEGGNIMKALPNIFAKGVKFIVPVGLEKMVGSVPDAHVHMEGIDSYTFSTGRGCGYISINNAIVVHEIESLRILTGVEAFHVASGGIGGSEGAVTLIVKGQKENLDATVDLIRRIKGEAALPAWKSRCKECQFRCRFIYPDK